MSNDNPFKKSIEEIKEMQKTMKEYHINDIKEGEDIRCNNNGPDCPRPTSKPSPDSAKEKDENNKNTEPDAGVVLFNNISDTVIKIFEAPEVVDRLKIVASNMKMDKSTISSLVEVISLCVVHASYESILFYDDLIKKELVKQFDNTVHHINLLKSESEAYKGVLQIHQRLINEINDKLKTHDLMKKM